MWWGEGGDGGKKGRLEAKARGWSILEVVPPARGSGCRPSSAHKPPLHSPTHNSSAHILHQLITTAAPSHPYSPTPSPELHHFEFFQIAHYHLTRFFQPDQTSGPGLLLLFLLLRHFTSIDYSIRAIVTKSVKISTNQFFDPKISTKNARFTTFLNLQQNSVNAFEIS